MYGPELLPSPQVHGPVVLQVVSSQRASVSDASSRHCPIHRSAANNPPRTTSNRLSPTSTTAPSQLGKPQKVPCFTGFRSHKTWLNRKPEKIAQTVRNARFTST